jgi:2-methylisocitrate lyase-like PEP mutase family enzyme
MTAGGRLRSLIEDDAPHLVFGTYDALSARVGEAVGYEALSMSGFGVAGSLLGVPDVGLVTLRESADVCRQICDAVAIPVIADADTGYGNALSVHRTVRMFEAAGAAGLHLEDQITPKRCGHMENKEVISTDEMVGKLGSALDARIDPEFCIIARTDARAVEGLNAALDRAQAYYAAGADVIFVEAPQSEAEIKQIASELSCPLLFNWSYDGMTPHVPRSWLEELGYKLVLFPDVTLGVHQALMALAAAVKSEDSLESIAHLLTGFDEFNRFVGLSDWHDLEARFVPGRSAIVSQDGAG